MARSRLHELEHEFVLRLRRIRRILVPGVVRIAQKIAFIDQLEASRFDFLPKKRLFDAMQGTGLGNASTGPPRMIGNNVETSRFERTKDRFVHRRAIHAEVSEVVIVEHQGYEIDAIRELRGN